MNRSFGIRDWSTYMYAWLFGLSLALLFVGVALAVCLIWMAFRRETLSYIKDGRTAGRGDAGFYYGRGNELLVWSLVLASAAYIILGGAWSLFQAGSSDADAFGATLAWTTIVLIIATVVLLLDVKWLRVTRPLVVAYQDVMKGAGPVLAAGAGPVLTPDRQKVHA